MVERFIIGLVMFGVGAYALYLTLIEQRMAARPGPVTRIARALVGVIALVLGAIAMLMAIGFIPRLS